MIGIVSYPEDPHASAVLGHLAAAGVPVTLLDLADFPDRATLTMAYENGHGPLLEYRRGEEAPLDLGTVRAMWWRRPQSADPAGVLDPEARIFAVNEWQEAIAGLWQLLETRWVNDPVRDEVAARKALQLRVAAQVGLAVPQTLVTSDPDRARRFVDGRAGAPTIYKTFSCTHEIWRETRLFGDAERELLDSVRLAPVIFQEYVPADVDLRITIVGERIFAAAIHSQSTDYPVDFRMSLGQADVEPTTLPAEVEQGLLRLMRVLGLEYGAVDMRRTPAGAYVFLEVNTGGEFLFIEERTGQQIAAALAELLAA